MKQPNQNCISSLDAQTATDEVIPEYILTGAIFPPPGANWGEIRYALIPNPRWRWWFFWRPRTIVMKI